MYSVYTCSAQSYKVQYLVHVLTCLCYPCVCFEVCVHVHVYNYYTTTVAGDLYVHADLHGATSVIVKNPQGG